MSEESETEAGATQPEVVIVTGMSGAGRSTAADALEDIGMFVIDNMPPPLIPASSTSPPTDPSTAHRGGLRRA